MPGRGRVWKLVGLAGVAGVAATGVALARNERRRRAYTPDEVRARLQARHAQALAARDDVAAGDEVASREEVAVPDGGRRPHLPDPELVARYETDAWAGYYLRDWRRVLRGALGMVREGFGTSRQQTARGAWAVLRANQAWAPFPVNDPDAARARMARFYRIAAAAQGWSIDPVEAARREVAWWAAHRQLQHADPDGGDAALVAALTDLYSYVYSIPAERVREAAVHRAAAMRVSDSWVAGGRAADDPRLAQVQAELVRSYRALRQGVLG